MTYEDIVTLTRKELEELTAPVQAPPIIASYPLHPTMLRVRALGGVEIYRGEERVDAGSQSARAREMLIYLLAHPSGATKEQIGAALWPEADGTKLRNNFHVTVHRLRKTLGGSDWVVSEGDTYVIDRKAGVDFDAEAFERQARLAIRSTDPVELTRAIEMYRGDFLDKAAAGEWYLPIRDKLRDLYSESLRTLGRTKLMAQDFAAAADVYKKLLELDDLDEQACRNLMTSLAHTGDAGGAALAYRRLVSALRRELDTEPDPATVKLHTKISEGVFRA